MTRTTPKPPPATDYCHTCQTWVESIPYEHPIYSIGQGDFVEMEYGECCPTCGNDVDRYEATP